MFRARLPSIFITSQKMPRPHAICTLVATDAALTMQFAKSPQHETSEALRLPCEMMMEVSKVLRLPQKLERIF